MESTTASRKRMKSTTVACPIVYGSVAIHLGKKAEEFSTHSWKLYIRGPNEEDLSSFIEKVAFTLHPSFSEPVRVVKAPPFEVSETGWGEFEASLRLYFRDPDEQPIDLFHLIKLYPANAPQQVGTLKKPSPVVSEQYDEVVFSDPSEKFYNQLMRYTADTSTYHRVADDMAVGTSSSNVFDDSLDLERLSSIQQHLSSEIEAAKVRLLQIQTQVVEAAQQRRLEQKQLIGGDGALIKGEGAGTDGVASANRQAAGKTAGSGGSRPGKGVQGQGAVAGAGGQGSGSVLTAAGAGAPGTGAPKRPRPAAKKPPAAAAAAAGSGVVATSLPTDPAPM